MKQNDISTLIMILQSIQVELSQPKLFDHGLEKYNQNRAGVGRMLSWLHHEGIKSYQVYFPSRVAIVEATKDNVDEITMLIEKSLMILKRGQQVFNAPYTA